MRRAVNGLIVTGPCAMWRERGGGWGVGGSKEVGGGRGVRGWGDEFTVTI